MMKKILFQLPEYYFIILIVAAGYEPPFSIPFFYIVLIIVLALQIYFANKVSGLLISGLLFFFNLLYLGALVSEISDFQEFNSDAQQMAVIGMLLWFLNLTASILMMYRYLKMKTRSSQRIKFY